MQRDADSERLGNVARVLRSVGQVHRIKILSFLFYKGPSTFSEIMKELNLSSGKLNFHLRKLRDAGLVKASEGGTYELTELGKWVLATLRDLERVGERRALIDYRGLPQTSSLSELAKELACASSRRLEVEAAIGEAYRKLSSLARAVSKEWLLMLAEIEACGREPSFICIPLEKARAVYKALLSERYAVVRDTLCRDLASLHAVEKLSPLLRDYQTSGLVYVRDPAYSIAKAQLVALGLPKGEDLAKVVAKLAPSALELLIAVDDGSQLKGLEIIDRLVEPGRVAVVIRGELEEPPRLDKINVVVHGEEAWRSSAATLLETVNAPTAVTLSRGPKVPSPSLADAPLPEPGEAYILTLRLAVPLTELYSEMRRSGADAYSLLDQIAGEAERVGGGLAAPQARRALREYASSVETLKPQLALVGFEAALRLHHSSLEPPRAVELAKRFWSTLASEFAGVELAAAMADERLYAFARSTLFNPLGAFSLSVARPLEELAALEGVVQGLLGGGSSLALRVKGLLSSEKLSEILSVAELSGVLRVSFHLEFTSCVSCGSTSAGWKGLCDLCLSDNVVQLARPLDVYVPVDAVPPEVFDEYSRRVPITF